ncbi:hypothetical protein Efla_001117 [Eimeria flavescens]
MAANHSYKAGAKTDQRCGSAQQCPSRLGDDWHPAPHLGSQTETDVTDFNHCVTLHARSYDKAREGVTRQDRRFCHQHVTLHARSYDNAREGVTRQERRFCHQHANRAQPQRGTHTAAFNGRKEAAALALSEPSEVWLLPVKFGAREVEALVDTAARRYFMLPCLASELNIFNVNLSHVVSFRVASGETVEVRAAAAKVAFMLGESWQYKTSATFLVTNIPCRVILGASWLWRETATWELRKKTATVGAVRAGEW